MSISGKGVEGFMLHEAYKCDPDTCEYCIDSLNEDANRETRADWWGFFHL